MSEQDLITEREKLEKKLEKARGPKAAQAFVAELVSLDKSALDKRLLDYAKTEQGIINTRNADEILADLKAKATEEGRKYREQLAGNKLLRRLTSLIISEKFGDVLMDRTEPKDEEV